MHPDHRNEMAEKCTKTRGGKLSLCDEADFAVSHGLMERVSTRGMERIWLRKGEVGKVGLIGLALTFCPFCRANVDTYGAAEACEPVAANE